MLILSLISNDSGRENYYLCYEVLVCDWHASILLNRTGGRRGFCRTASLDKDRLLVFVVDYPAIVVDNKGSDSLALLIFDNIRTLCTIRSNDEESSWDVSAYSTLSPVLEFGFPVFSDGTKIPNSGFLLHCSPPPSSATFQAPTFLPDTFCRTLHLGMEASVDGIFLDFLIFIDVKKLLHHRLNWA